MKQALKTEATYSSEALITFYQTARYQNSEYQFTLYHCYKYFASHLLSTENGGRKLLRNIGNYVPVGMTSHPRRFKSSSTLLTEPQISRILRAHACSLNSNATHRRITKYRTTDIFNFNKKYQTKNH